MSSTIEKSADAISRRGSPKPLTHTAVVSNTTTALLAGVAGKSIRVYKIFISGTATVAAGILEFRDGTTAKIIRNISVVALGYESPDIDFGNTPWELADGATLNLVTTGATAMTYNIGLVADQVTTPV